MRCDTCLVIGGTAAVEPPAAFGRLERWRKPLRAVTFGLYVVVGVQQHGGRPRWRRVVRDDSRGAALTDNFDVVKTGLGQQVRYRLRTAVYLVAAILVGPDRGDSHQVLEIAPHRRQQLAYSLNQISHASMLVRGLRRSAGHSSAALGAGTGVAAARTTGVVSTITASATAAALDAAAGAASAACATVEALQSVAARGLVDNGTATATTTDTVATQPSAATLGDDDIDSSHGVTGATDATVTGDDAAAAAASAAALGTEG